MERCDPDDPSCPLSRKEAADRPPAPSCAIRGGLPRFNMDNMDTSTGREGAPFRDYAAMMEAEAGRGGRHDGDGDT